MASMEAGQLLQRAASGVSSLWFASVVQRILTFGLNALLLQFVSAEVLGFASSDMELLLSTIMFMSRESSRMVALRASVHVFDKQHSIAARQLVNVAWLPVIPGVLAAAAAALWFSWSPASLGQSLQGERAASLLYCLAAAIETFAEPSFILTQTRLLYSARASTEIVAAILKCCVVYLLAAGLGSGAVAFALGQVSYATCLLIGYTSHALHHAHRAQSETTALPDTREQGRAGIAALLPCALPCSQSGFLPWIRAQFGDESTSLLAGFTGQTAVKHVLTELDRLLLTGLTTRQQRGEYAVAANYGSLAARLLFQPLEELVRGATAKLLPGKYCKDINSGVADSAGLKEPLTGTTKSAESLSPRFIQSKIGSVNGDPLVAVRLFLTVLRGVTIVGAVFAVFGTAYSGTLVSAGLNKWVKSDVPQLLSAYAVYVLCLGLNGITEAFAMAAADKRRIAWSNLHLAVSALACTGAALWALPRFGTKALVWINCANMLLRVGSSCYYIADLVPGLQSTAKAGERLISLRNGMPSVHTGVAFVTVAGILHAARAELPQSPEDIPLREQMPYVAIGALSAMSLVTFLWITEGQSLLGELRALQAGKNDSVNLIAVGAPLTTRGAGCRARD